MTSDLTNLLQKAVNSVKPYSLTGQKALIMLARDDVNIGEVAEILQADQGIATRLLSLANSAEIGVRRNVRTVADSIVIIGLAETRRIIYSVMAHVAFGGTMDHDTWYHGLNVAYIAQHLAFNRRTSVDSDEAFLAGLIHDVGLVFLNRAKPAECKIIAARVSEGANMLEAETNMFGMDHAEIGGFMAEHWQLPQSIEMAIRHHHNPAEAATPLDRIVLVSNGIADEAHSSSNGDQLIDESVLKRLNMTFDEAREAGASVQKRVDEFMGKLYHIF